MKNYLLSASVLVFIAVACQSTDDKSNLQGSEGSSLKDGVFVHISKSYNDPHRVLMPLKMASLMASDKDVLVYLDIDAVNFLVKGSPDIEFGEFESAHTYIRKLLDHNVGIYACPTCLAVAGFKPEDLIKGVRIAEKDKFFNFTKGRILNLDY
jgi:predicted peroxiredoxin